MEQLTLFKVRDLRKKDQFKIDDIYLNGYARICGVNATLVYLSLCRHAEFESQKAFPSQNKIGFELGISVASVKRGIKKLAEYNVISIEKEKMEGKFSNNVYYLLDKSEWKPAIAPQDTRQNHSSNTVAHTPPTVRDTLKDNKVLRITNIKDNKELATQGIAGKEINDLIEFFKPINPTYERLFSNKTQRQALERLVKKFGREKVEQMIKYLPKIFGKPYAPRISTPYLLELKLADLLGYLQQEKLKPPKGVIIRE